MPKVEFSDLQIIIYAGGVIFAFLAFLYTLDPLWFIAIYIVDIATAQTIIIKLKEHEIDASTDVDIDDE